MPVLRESDVRSQIRDFMQHRGWRAVRTQFAFSPGSFSTGEPGMADELYLYYTRPGHGLILWCEYKGPRDKRTCTCRVGDRKVCKQCRQKQWQDRERKRGATVVEVSEFEAFAVAYERAYGWLHRGEQARGQMELEVR